MIDLPFNFVLVNSDTDETTLLSLKDATTRYPNIETSGQVDRAILHKVFGEVAELKSTLFNISMLIGSYVDDLLFENEEIAKEDSIDYKELYAYMEQDDQAILDFINRKYGKERKMGYNNIDEKSVMNEKEMREEIIRLKNENELLKEENRKLRVILYEC